MLAVPVTAECRFCIFIQGTPTAPPKWNGMESSTAVACAPGSPRPPAAGNYGLFVFWPSNGTGDIASESETGRKKIYADISTARCTHITLLAVALLLNW